MDTNEQWLTVRGAARALGKSERTIRRWVASGKIPADRDTGGLLVDVAGLTPGHATTTPDVAGEVAALRAEIERLGDLLAEVRAERDYLRAALSNAQAVAMSLTGEQRLLTERAGEPRRRFRWPWQRGEG